jgi:hypothetical protein
MAIATTLRQRRKESEERMANTRARATSSFNTPFLEDLIGSIPNSKKRGKHIGFREIRIKNGRVEFDYTVNAGNVTNEGTMIVRYADEDELGQLAKKLAEQFGNLYVEVERA